MMEDVWYKDGVRFTCTQCGNCCTGPPGYVWFTDEEAEAMAARLELTVPAFLKKYAHRVFGKYSLDESRNARGEYDCIFLHESKEGKRTCSIYNDRPMQCRTWPFWSENLESEAAWERASERCPGMTRGNEEGQGTFFPIEKIRIIRDQNNS